MRFGYPGAPEPKVGDTVYDLYAARPKVIGKISKTGMIAFGSGPYRSADYEPPWRYTPNEAYAIGQAIASAEAEVRYARQRLDKATRDLAESDARVASLGRRRLALEMAS